MQRLESTTNLLVVSVQRDPKISDALTGSYNLGTLGVYLDKSDHNLSIRTQWGAYSSTSLFILDVATQSQKDHKLFTTTYNLCSKKKRQ